MARVLAISTDLLLGSKVEATLRAAGHEVTLSPSLQEAPLDEAELLVGESAPDRAAARSPRSRRSPGRGVPPRPRRSAPAALLGPGRVARPRGGALLRGGYGDQTVSRMSRGPFGRPSAGADALPIDMRKAGLVTAHR